MSPTHHTKLGALPQLPSLLANSLIFRADYQTISFSSESFPGGELCLPISRATTDSEYKKMSLSPHQDGPANRFRSEPYRTPDLILRDMSNEVGRVKRDW